ncbi:MAG: phospho-N-acetylmuramoyl-pentapeptide-transferase [Eubacteriales bacterium]|nr:phospho-N-acetylmuramoyl-pentapeptide-transferase [Eubacteriales bacterium]
MLEVVLNVLTTPSVWMALTVLVLTILAGLAGLPLLRYLGVGQTVRDDGPKTHYIKTGTPTFGGFFFLVSIVVVYLIAGLVDGFTNPQTMLLLLMLTFAFSGFLDDYIKVRISKKGLSVKHKTILLMTFSILFTAYYLFAMPVEPFLVIPGLPQPILIMGWWKLLYAPFVIVYLFFITNSVNLTDGVDGLASTVTVVSSLALVAGGMILIPLGLDQGLLNAGMAYSAMIAAGCLGFLVYNRYPAKVFMGDTGSQALGAGLAGIALYYGAPWLLGFVGLIYVIESLSVIIQVAYFKRTGGKRIFRMSPIHHHFELGGWKETKVVLIFTAVTLVGSLIGLYLLVLVG